AHLGNLVTALVDMSYIAYRTQRVLWAPIDEKLFQGVFENKHEVLLEQQYANLQHEQPQDFQTTATFLLKQENSYFLWLLLRKHLDRTTTATRTRYWAKRLMTQRFGDRTDAAVLANVRNETLLDVKHSSSGRTSSGTSSRTPSGKNKSKSRRTR
ncbi:unnamed protein product, partial [Amoebophrya sp. A25]